MPSLMIFRALSFAVKQAVDTDAVGDDVGDIAHDVGSEVVAEAGIKTDVCAEAAEDVD